MKTCKVDGCNNKHLAKGYCNKHYRQMRRHGEILDRTRFTPNEIVIYDNYAEIILYDNQNKEKSRAIIDIDDIDKVKLYKWGLSGDYVFNKITGTLLHRFIMNCPEYMVVDHINHNPLDNRKCNLRVCTQDDNMKNQKKRINNTSGYTGVYWHKNTNKWIARITVNKKHIYLGCYDNLEEAIEVRKKAEEKYFCEYKNN